MLHKKSFWFICVIVLFFVCSVYLLNYFTNSESHAQSMQKKSAWDSDAAMAKDILEATEVKGGLVVHIGCGDGKLTAALCAGDGYLVQGLDTDAANIEKAREYVHSLDIYGKVSIKQWNGKRLPYIDNLVNLVVAEKPVEVSMDEIMRVLAPKGVAYIKKDGQWKKSVKSRPKDIDEWTHYMHDATNNAVAQDSAIGPPRRLQWVGSPRWARHHDHMASMSGLVSSGGRMFYIFDEGPTSSIELPSNWFLIARDAFNGSILWKRHIDKWHTQLWPLKSGPAQLPRRLVAIDDTVYVTLGIDAPLSALDAATGETIRTYQNTESTEEVIFSDGILYLVIRRWGAKRNYSNIQEVRQQVKAPRWSGGNKVIMAIHADTGQVLWQKESWIAPLTLALDQKRVFFYNGEKVVALNRENGKEAWTSEPLPVWSMIRSWFAPTLVVYKDVVIFAGGENMIPHRGGKDSMTALSAETGEKLWTAEHPPGGYQSPEDVLVAGGLVWSGATTSGGYDGVFKGLDPWTGEVKNQFPPDVDTYWFHHRCYRAKATEQYLLTSRTGIEFLDINENHWTINHWVRGGCLYGIMPCNGMVYAPPHDCACYPEAKLYGFNALAPAAEGTRITNELSDHERLERGPAYDQPVESSSTKDDWPTYRNDISRSGFTKTKVPAELETLWESEIGGKLSSVVVAEGKLFLASVDIHMLHVLDAESGEHLWSYTAGGRIDSPPTLYQGRVLFGAKDGCVYCLRATDGELIWRFHAAPIDQQLVAFEQVESVWPVHGSVLVQDDVVYFVAGRSMFLDDGMRLYQLDPKTGRKIDETVLDERNPETGESLQERIMILNMPVGLPDILSSDGDYIYMKSQLFDLEGNRLALGPHSGNPAEQGSVQHGEEAHLFCPTGFLDDTWFHRAYWVFGRSFAGGHGGYWQAGRFAPSGRILVFDDSSVYGFARKPQYYRWTTPLEYHLFSTDKQPPVLDKDARRGSRYSMISVGKSESLNPAGKSLTVEAWVKAENKNGAVVARGGSSHGYALVIRNGKPQFSLRVDGKVNSVSSEEEVTGKWTHIAGVLTADKRLQIYVNGKLSAFGEKSGFIVYEPSEAMQIGTDDGSTVGDYSAPLGFKGIIDEVKIYDGALSASEIEEHYQSASKESSEATLVLYYSFDNEKATDSSGNKNHGEVKGAKFVEGKFGKGIRFTGSKKQKRHLVEYHWSQEIPILVRAMVLADETLFIAGPEDLVNEEEVVKRLNDSEIKEKLNQQVDALEGRRGAFLWAVSASSGKKLAEYHLDSLPVWDGMTAADGKLYLSTTDGKVMCMGGK